MAAICSNFWMTCWLYGDKEAIAGIYMCPVVMSTTYGEREGKLNLATAWEILGGTALQWNLRIYREYGVFGNE